MTSACKGGGKFVGKWSVSVRNTTPCPELIIPLVANFRRTGRG